MKPPKKGPVSLDSILSKNESIKQPSSQSRNWNVRNAYSMVTEKPQLDIDQQEKNTTPVEGHAPAQVHSTDNQNAKNKEERNENSSSDKSRDKVETKQIQSENKLELENSSELSSSSKEDSHLQPETNQRQSGDKGNRKAETKQRQTGDTFSKVETESFKTRDKVPPKVETALETKRRQTGDKLETSLAFSSLVGLQRTLVIEIYNSCKMTRSLYSEPLSIEHLTKSTQSTVSSVKKSLQRLEQKEVIKRIEFKNGRGGWTIYTIIDSVYQAILRTEAECQLETKWRQTRDKVESQLGTELETTIPSKLVSNINNNLLTSAELKSSNSENDDQLDIIAINIEPLQKFNITRKQIQDIKNQKLNFTTSTLQDFVDRFIIYTSEPKNIKGVNSIPAIFVRMAQLAAKGQDPLADIETDADRLIRERLERLKAKQEERLKQKQELLEIEFEEWLAEAELDVINKIAPPTTMMKQGSVAQKMTLKSYFVENVWNQKTGNIFFKQLEN